MVGSSVSLDWAGDGRVVAASVCAQKHASTSATDATQRHAIDVPTRTASRNVTVSMTMSIKVHTTGWADAQQRAAPGDDDAGQAECKAATAQQNDEKFAQHRTGRQNRGSRAYAGRHKASGNAPGRIQLFQYGTACAIDIEPIRATHDAIYRRIRHNRSDGTALVASNIEGAIAAAPGVDVGGLQKIRSRSASSRSDPRPDGPLQGGHEGGRSVRGRDLGRGGPGGKIALAPPTRRDIVVLRKSLNRLH